MSENLEVMEITENDNYEIEETEDYTYDSEESGKVIGLVVAGVAGAVTLGVLAYKKLKAKSDGKPEMKRKKLMWVEVDDDVTEPPFFDDYEEMSEEVEE